MMQFDVSGRMMLGKEERIFTKRVEAKSENAAKDKTYALLGSHNRVKRNKIKIEKVEKI